MQVMLGSVVSLKSGDQLMTAENFGEHADARCSQFVDMAIQQEWLASIALQPQNPPKAIVASGAKKVVK